MLFLTQSAAVYGIDAPTVDTEINLQRSPGKADMSPQVIIVALAFDATQGKF